MEDCELHVTCVLSLRSVILKPITCYKRKEKTHEAQKLSELVNISIDEKSKYQVCELVMKNVQKS